MRFVDSEPEDLGGGTTANFVFETNLNTSTAVWAPGIRQGWAGLAQKGMGAVRIGTQFVDLAIGCANDHWSVEQHCWFGSERNSS